MTIEITLNNGTTETARYCKPLRRNPETMTPEKFYQKLCELYDAGKYSTDDYVRPVSYKVVEA